jgi:hypothetical protein
MSPLERNEYMKNVRWTTALYVGASAIGIMLSICGLYFGLKGDIKDGRTEARELITYFSTKTNFKIDSIQHLNELQFQEIREELINNKNIKNPFVNRFFTEKYVNGQLVLIPVK